MSFLPLEPPSIRLRSLLCVLKYSAISLLSPALWGVRPVLVLRTHTPVAAELCRVSLVLAASLIIALLLWYLSSGGLLSLVVVPCFFSS